MKIKFLVLIILLPINALSQTLISGTVRDKRTGDPIPFANVYFSGTSEGTITDINGNYKIQLREGAAKLVASFLGYQKDTLQIAPGKTVYRFSLIPHAGSLTEVVISGTMKEMSKLESAIPVEVYMPEFFAKNPAPNIFESLNMVNGVQPQLNCNVCNTGDIHINGMEGPYTMVLIDGMPIVSSLSTVYGLAGIPNSMVKRIEIVKGPASGLYGSEAVAGLINIITKDPVSAPLLNVDFSSTTYQEFNLDVSAKIKTRKAVSLLGANVFWYDKIHDVNNDGFTDITLQKRLSVFNKWDFKRTSGLPASLALRFINEIRWGGETNWNEEFRGTDSIYGESIYTDRAEVIGVYGIPVTGQNIRLQYSYNFHRQDSYYGIVKFFAEQHTAFGQLLWDKTINKHSLLLGVPFRFIHYDDNTAGTSNGIAFNQPQLTYLPGILIQDEIKNSEKLTTLLGIRYDHNNYHGNILTPRLSIKYTPVTNHTFRLSMGNGFRVVNLFTEDHAALTGARKVIIRESLDPEQCWNANLNYVTQFNYKAGFTGIDITGFYTYFTNKIVADYMSDPELIVYNNLDGFAVSKGISINSDIVFTNGFKIIAGITYMKVYQVNKDSLGEQVKTPQLFAPDFSGTFTITLPINRSGFSVDLTGRVNGPMSLPVLPNDYRPDKSPWFCVMNIQLTKKFRNRLEIYTGLKNILNMMPDDPIMRPFDPFDKDVTVNNPYGYTFDPSYNYAPVQGIKGFLGVRWTL